MKKVLNRKISLVVMLFMFMAVLQLINSVDRPNNINKLPQMQMSQIVSDNHPTDLKTSIYQLIAGVCAILLLGYLFGSLIRKSHRDSLREQHTREKSLYDISLATGRSEYDLFHKSAEGWPVSEDKIKRDFKRYMSDQFLPHYAQDFVRKNRKQIDPSLIVKRKVKATSWKDWAIALMVFPGSLLFLYLIMVTFDKV